ncbi:addiction module antidote protein [Cupriavidus plantarum]|uniref:addiction module antidote protein n=1 Tax=Cupriavidus plantarum TaxID=942865 RepID=UPI000F24FEE5|nr:addiction module antidote protein [Cupriavidus plantarum]RLK44296.1 putative addiction module antidote protein [Cupriavidus plantarum]CAG2142384.1 hypothetical protein LMG26296_03202 [Cupriavidus plantarum]SMR65497.1 probable addiction module antidote protein [Cupriavidus plantarum]
MNKSMSVSKSVSKSKAPRKPATGGPARYAASVPLSEATIEALGQDRELAVEFLRAAMEELDDPENRAVGLLALRDIAEAYGGMTAVAQEAGITREALYRALSPSGNPTLKTIVAVLRAVGMRLSVVPA